jgi:hypothetical protein
MSALLQEPPVKKLVTKIRAKPLPPPPLTLPHQPEWIRHTLIHAKYIRHLGAHKSSAGARPHRLLVFEWLIPF